MLPSSPLSPFARYVEASDMLPVVVRNRSWGRREIDLVDGQAVTVDRERRGVLVNARCILKNRDAMYQQCMK